VSLAHQKKSFIFFTKQTFFFFGKSGLGKKNRPLPDQAEKNNAESY